MKHKTKRHFGLIVFLIMVFAFPVGLSYQARLNMRIIVTGVAIDKVEDEYQVTAQILKTMPGSKPPGTAAEIDFLIDKSKVLSEAVAKLAYKAGKVSSFTHTNFIVVGKSILEEDVLQCLDYFVRDKIIKNSALILFAEDSAAEEIQKTKKTELSVGIGLQKVFKFKEINSDGLMVTMIDFLKQSHSNTGTAVASTLKFDKNKDETKKSSGEESGGSGEESGSGGSGSSGGESGSGGSGSQSGSQSEEYEYFKQDAPLMCFVDGKFAGKIEDSGHIKGYMFLNKDSEKSEVSLESVTGGRLNGSRVEIAINNKKSRAKIRFENGEPIFDLTVDINKSEIDEINSEKIIGTLTEEEFDAIEKEFKKAVEKHINDCFETAKGFNADVFNCYDYAYKFAYKDTMDRFDKKEDFLKNVKLNISVNIKQMDY